MISVPKGTKDLLPQESYKWQYIEDKIKKVTKLYNFKQIMTPTFEFTELFVRGVGTTTDVVNKEMYTFNDRSNQSITLKPEGTAGVARAYISNSLYSEPQPIKMFYITPVFRYEKPQKGRLREHHQFGVELFGSYEAEADVEVIALAKSFLNSLGVKDLVLKINSIGCKECRKIYNQKLKEFYERKLSNMCSTCKERFNSNPLRMLDCKEQECKNINKDAPKVLDYICDDCKNHHEKVLKSLDALNIKYEVDPQIVRGLDYYTRTVFEFVSNSIGSQSTVCGGGRYNHLVEEIGDIKAPAVGFGLGIERLILTMESLGLDFGNENNVELFIGSIGEEAQLKSIELANKLRNNLISCEIDLLKRSVKSQMKYANKIKAKYSLIIGEREIEEDLAEIKSMQDSTKQQIKLSKIEEFFK